MLISNLINNNYVAAMDENGNEVIVKGIGIGYNAKKGSYIPDERIEKIYRINDGNIIQELGDLIQNIPEDRFSVCEEIIDYAKKKLKTDLNPNLYVTLTDHVNYALIRESKGIQISNPMINDIRTFYPEEFSIGKYAVCLVNKKLRVSFGEDEAGFIALHIVNAEANTVMNTTIKTTKLVKTVLQIIEEFFELKMKTDTVNYRRLIIHLQLIASNVFQNKSSISRPDAFNSTIYAAFPLEIECSRKISEYIRQNYQYRLNEDELAYLAVNISRVRIRKKK